MRRLVAALVVTAALGLSAAALARVAGEPVRLTVHTPDSVRVHSRLGVAVVTATAPGALDIAAKPLRMQVRLARECGATFGTTPGPTVIDHRLPPPQPGARYRAAVKGLVRIGHVGKQTVCAFLVDSEKRQFATSVDKVVRVRR